MKIFNVTIRILIFNTLLFFSTAVPAQEVLKGGGGGSFKEAYCPYSSINIPIKDAIIIMKIRSDSCRTIKIESFKCSSPIAITYIKEGKINSTPKHIIQASSENNEHLSIPFGIISSLKIIQHDLVGQKSLIEINIFPTIEAEKLVKKRLKYIPLLHKHSSKRMVWLNHNNLSGGELAFTYIIDKDKYKIGINSKFYVKIADLSENEDIEFGYTLTGENAPHYPVWWAIPSVSKSKNFPYGYNIYANAPFGSYEILSKGVLFKQLP